MLASASAWLKLGLKAKSSLSPIQKGSKSWKGQSVRNYKVTVVGAGGGIGQPLSMLLKQNPLIDELTLHDVAGVKGVAADLGHICTATRVDHFEGVHQDTLIDALHDSNVVVVPAGLPRKPGMSRDQLFDANASVAMAVACAASSACPEALLAFITNPINSIVPVAAQFLKTRGTFDPNRLFGVTTLDVMRAKTFIAEYMNIDPARVDIPVVGGHAGRTIMPLFSQCSPRFLGELEDVKLLTQRIQVAGTEVVQAKEGRGSATLAMAYAGAHFVNALLRALNDEPNVVECAYVASNVTELPFFATPLVLGPQGIKTNLGLPPLDMDEAEALKVMLPMLRQNIEKGINFAEQVIKASNLDEEETKKTNVPKSAKMPHKN